MLSKQQNDLMTLTGRGTAAGKLLRHYWQPIALSEEIPPGGRPVPVRILGEDLVLFRDEANRPGLLGLRCSHRAADLSYGKIENGGLRCLYHGWLYGIDGSCLGQPGEPPESRFKEKVQHPAYPCRERGEIVFAYLGGGEPPVLPDYVPLMVAPEYRLTTKVRLACNYAQSNEGNFDPTHLSFLHGTLSDRNSQGSPQRRIRGSEQTRTDFERQYKAPAVSIEETDFGLRIFTRRPAGPGKNYVSTTNFVFPNLAVVAGSPEGFRICWHVPIDDTHHWRWDIMCQLDKPFPEDERAFFRNEVLPDGTLIRNPSNRYLQNPQDLSMGPNFIVHDAYATEGQGPIQDRTVERLGSTDKAIAAVRRLLLEAIDGLEEGREPRHVIRDPAQRDMSHIVSSIEVVPSEEWANAWRIRGAEVRQARGTWGQPSEVSARSATPVADHAGTGG
jgi:phthalate 4,5-dioxygenase oxygenase subunit